MQSNTQVDSSTHTHLRLNLGGIGSSRGGTGGGGGPSNAALLSCCSSLATRGCSRGLPWFDRGVRRLDTPQHSVPCKCRQQDQEGGGGAGSTLGGTAGSSLVKRASGGLTAEALSAAHCARGTMLTPPPPLCVLPSWQQYHLAVAIHHHNLSVALPACMRAC
jgi:hypothetical protein